MSGILTCDVAVIGGGPAGATLGALLAMRGVDVVVLEKDRFPRDKVCGEFLSWDAMPVLEAIGATAAIDALGAPAIDRGRLTAGNRSIDFRLPGTARGVSRWSLDRILLDTAAARGARVLEGWSVTRCDARGARFEIELAGREGELLRVGCRIPVGAWGRWGRLDHALGRSFVKERTDRYVGFKRHFAAGATDPGMIELVSFPGGYLGAQAVEGGRSNLCGLVHHSEIAEAEGGWERYAESLRARSPRLGRLFALEPAQERFLSSEPVIFRPKAPVERGLWLIGDSAGLIDPLTGSGMAMAIQSAALAAQWIGRGDAAGYAAAHRSFFGRRILWSRAAAAMLRSHRWLERALGLPGAGKIAAFLAGATRAAEGATDGLAG